MRTAMKDKWVKRWPVISRHGNPYTVAQDKDGNWGCSCPRWTMSKYRGQECDHIKEIKNQLEREAAKTLT